MSMTITIMEIDLERVIILVIVFITVIDARAPINTKAEHKLSNIKTRNRTKLIADAQSVPTKRDLKYVTSEPNKPKNLSEILNLKLKELIGEDDATKLEFIKNIRDVLGVNSYENKEDVDVVEALRRGDNADFATNNYLGPRFNSGKMRTLGFPEQGLPNSVPLLPLLFYRTALRRSMLNQRRFNRFIVNQTPSYAKVMQRDVLQSRPSQAKLQSSLRKIPATMQGKQLHVQQIQATTQPLQQSPNLPLQRLETETVLLMNHHEIQKNDKPVVLDSNDNAYPYEPILKR